MLLGVVWLLGAVVIGEVLPEVWKDIASQYLEREGSKCKGCQGVKELLEHILPELNITEMRLELFKQSLLERLGMTSPPRRKVPPLPDLVRSGNVFQSSLPVRPSQSPATQRLVLIPKDVNCSMDSEGLNLKVNFDLPIQAVDGNFVSSKLWLHGESTWTGPITAESCGPIQQVSSLKSSSKEGWFDGDVSVALQNRVDCFSFKIPWPEKNHTNHNCSVYEEISQKAFIMTDITTAYPTETVREKRNINCVEGLNECCREKLFVSFARIGWDDWIIQPRGYEAYYCKGTCANVASISIGASPYHSVIKKLYTTEGNKLQIAPCCTPTLLSPAQLIYMDVNGTFVQRTIPNLTVEACGCM